MYVWLLYPQSSARRGAAGRARRGAGGGVTREWDGNSYTYMYTHTRRTSHSDRAQLCWSFASRAKIEMRRPIDATVTVHVCYVRVASATSELSYSATVMGVENMPYEPPVTACPSGEVVAHASVRVMTLKPCAPR